MSKIIQLVLGASLLLILQQVQSFYLPGVNTKEFNDGDKVEVKVNSLTSPSSYVPFEYYSLPFCQPEQVTNTPENLGEYLTGNRIENSLYDVKMNTPVFCKLLCAPKSYTAEQLGKFVERIDEHYRVNMIMDNMPAVSTILVTKTVADKEPVLVESIVRGFLLGVQVKKEEDTVSHALYNHLTITVKYHTAEEFEGKRVVEFIVEPSSVDHKISGGKVKGCTSSNALFIGGPKYEKASGKDGSMNIAWTYDTAFEYSPIKWASRWDVYFKMDSNLFDVDKVHWVSIINSMLIVLFLTGMIGIILMRTLNKDFTRYNQLPTDEEKAEAQEESGWKLVHADVFRPPTYPMLFTVATGTGVQLICCIFIVLIFAMLGFLSPASRGYLVIALLLLFVLMAIPAGFVGARLYKTFGGKQWHRQTLLIAIGYPGIVFAGFFIVNFALWIEQSSGAVPFKSMFAILALWLGISCPLCFLGAVRGYKKDPIEYPVAISRIPKDIPSQAWYMSKYFTVPMGAVLPFGAVLVESFFILQSLWLGRVYYVFGFLFIVFTILLITCIEISIVLCYFQLCSEDYRWWWRAMWTPGFSAFFLFLYSCWFFTTRGHELLFVSSLVYFVYMSLVAWGFFFATGSVGSLSCLMFTRAIYGSIKVD